MVGHHNLGVPEEPLFESNGWELWSFLGQRFHVMIILFLQHAQQMLPHVLLFNDFWKTHMYKSIQFQLSLPATDECLLVHSIFIPFPFAGISTRQWSIRTLVEALVCDGLMMFHVTLFGSAPIQDLLTPNHGVQHQQLPGMKTTSYRSFVTQTKGIKSTNWKKPTCQKQFRSLSKNIWLW